MDLERGAASAPPTSMTASRAPAKQVAISIGDDDEFGMELERGGALAALAPASSTRPHGPTSVRPAGSGLDVAYRRLDPKRVVETGPSTGQKIAAWAVPIIVALATLVALVQLAHRHGGRNVMSILPHAFDASSTAQSGAFAGVALVVAIALGFTGLKLKPRSYAMVASGACFLLASLAMVTVTLVSTEDPPGHPDGALLIPYVVPLGISLLGLGLAGRGPRLFLEGGSRRVASLAAALFGAALVFVGIEISALAARLP